ncbi:YgfZ/GcvT domain-containing protein [Capilliphycus salinus ALCB114379]|uniref:CAF17-like 4Fe-4S cluster assembly/insertion protein YgfZ n=1 Tax=Capilliphycus salinus TaxID=2768948 RepID=UPI0039A5C6FB
MTIQTLREIQAVQGAKLEESTSIPLSFGNDTEAIAATQTGVALCDRSHWGLLQISDEDRLRFLHNQSTNNIQSLQPGQGCDSVFVSSTARTIDLTTLYVTEDGVLVLVSPNRRQMLIDWLDRYIFPMDRVELKDISAQNVIFSLLGPESDQLLEKLGITPLTDKPYASHKQVEIDNIPVRIAVGSGLVTPGYTLIVSVDRAVSLWKTLIEAGVIPMGNRVWEQLRIKEGRPVPDFELTDDYNPLEAGLWKTISFEKGCYIGQETIARLNTYKGVKQRLWGLKLNAPVAVGTEIKVEDQKVGKLTSLIETEEGFFGLGYIRSKAGGKGLKVKVAEVEAEVVEVPFLTHPAE